MAELLIAKGWTPPDPLALALEENLPDGWLVVIGPAIWGCTLDAIVVSQYGLAVLYARDWAGALRVTSQGAWILTLPTGESQPLSDPAIVARAATQAILKFLADEFPALHPPIAHLIVITGTATPPPDAEARFVRVVCAADVYTGIEQLLPEEGDAILSVAQQATLAQALCCRRLTWRQRAAAPFVLRSGSALGRQRTTWTIAEIAAHFDRSPEDGVYHLRNGDLTRWFEEQGADHLAEAARAALRAYPLDTRAALEVLLQATGLVQPPGISVYPSRLDLEPVVAGAERAVIFRVRQQGRGYLFGTLHTDDPWLHLESHSFAGVDSTVLLRASTTGMFISAEPVVGVICISSPVARAAIELPVQLRVRPQPSAWGRHLVWPWLWAATAAAAGALLTWGLAVAGFWLPVAPLAQVALAVSILWALVGLALGARQHRAASPVRAWVRWMVHLSAWAVGLSAGAALLLWVWAKLDIPLPGWLLAAPLLVGVCAVVGAAITAARQVDPLAPPQRVVERFARWTRRAAVTAAIAVLVTVLLVGWQRDDIQQHRLALQQWVMTQLTEADVRLATWGDQLLLHYYDRRAQVEAPSLFPTVTPAPDARGG